MRAGKRRSDPAAVGRRRLTGALASLLFYSLAAGASAQETDAANTPPEVVALEVRSEAALQPGLDAASLFAFEVGDPLDAEAVRRTLSNAHAAGRFTHVELVTRPHADGGVVAVLVLESPRRVVDIEFDGERVVGRAALREALRLDLGAPLDESALRATQERLADLHRAAGYFEAAIEPRIAEAPGGNVALTFLLRPGPRAVIRSIGWQPTLEPALDAAMRQALETETGDAYERERLDEDRDRLRVALVERGHLAATVEGPIETYDFDRARVEISFSVVAGPRYTVQVDGIPRRRLARRDLLPDAESQPFDVGSLGDLCWRLRDDLQRRGHYRATADCRELIDTADARRLRFEVEAGPRFEVASISFPGLHQLNADALRRRMTTSVRGRWSVAGGRLVDSELAADLENLRSYALLEGFRDAKIGPAAVRADPDDPQQLHVEIPIAEGDQQRVVDVRLVGAEALERERLLKALPLEAGGPYHPLRVADAENALQTLYEESGRPDTTIKTTVAWDPDEVLADVTFSVVEGRKRRIDRVILRGHHRTRTSLVRDVVDLDPGDTLTRRRLLEAERDLYRLGVFSRVEVQEAPNALDSSTRDVLIDLEEARLWRLAYGLSYHSDDGIGALFGITRANLFGRGASLQLDARGSENDQRLRLIYDQPTIGGLELPATATLFARNEVRESFDVEEVGTRLSVIHDERRRRIGLAYEYRLVQLEQEVAAPIDATTLDREDREVEISSLSPTLFLERRDDPIDPNRGWSTSLAFEWAFPSFDTDSDFVKGFWQQTQYVDLGGLGHLAGSFRAGLIEPLGDGGEDPLVPDDLASASIPISERFFAGGRTTHRAYERDRLGRLDETLIETSDGRLVEAGGNGLLLLNLDWRFPLAGPVNGVAFLDLGNVWADWRDVELDDLRPGAGLGLRYRSPIGPMRFEIGWKLDPEPFEEDAPVFFFSFGNPF
ncbi:MAG: POTRA domain-containing protein [Acidobacteriota bacterium]